MSHATALFITISAQSSQTLGLETMADTDAPGPAPAPGPPPAPPQHSDPAPQQNEGTTAVAERPAPSKAPPKPKLDKMPPYKVLLHNDDHNEPEFVTMAVMQIAGVHAERAYRIMLEAHVTGVSLVCITHRELAELKCEQLQSKGLSSTMEPA